MSNKRILLIIIVILLIAVIGTITIINKNGKDKGELQTINVSEVTRSVFYAPQYVAINNGFFEKNGINIELTTSSGADAVMTQVLANQCEIGFAGPEASIYVYNEGKEDYCQVFAQMTKKDGSLLVSKNPNEDFEWTDVKGTTIIPVLI